MILVLACCISCVNENNSNPKPTFVPGTIIKHNQFWDDGFDPYPESELTGYLSQTSVNLLEKYVSGLSFLSEYIGDNYDDFDPDPLVIANAYLVANSQSTILALPGFAYDYENDNGFSTIVENAILTILDNADLDNDPIDEESYNDFVDAIDNYNVAGIPDVSRDSVAAILYMGQILMHWVVYEPLWDQNSEPQIGGDGSHPRYRCWCPWCGCSINISSSDIHCAEAVIGGTLLGGSAGSILGAFGGGLLAIAEFC